jgi:hypothetical protein
MQSWLDDGTKLDLQNLLAADHGHLLGLLSHVPSAWEVATNLPSLGLYGAVRAAERLPRTCSHGSRSTAYLLQGWSVPGKRADRRAVVAASMTLDSLVCRT